MNIRARPAVARCDSLQLEARIRAEIDRLVNEGTVGLETSTRELVNVLYEQLCEGGPLCRDPLLRFLRACAQAVRRFLKERAERPHAARSDPPPGLSIPSPAWATVPGGSASLGETLPERASLLSAETIPPVIINDCTFRDFVMVPST